MKAYHIIRPAFAVALVCAAGACLGDPAGARSGVAAATAPRTVVLHPVTSGDRVPAATQTTVSLRPVQQGEATPGTVTLRPVGRAGASQAVGAVILRPATAGQAAFPVALKAVPSRAGAAPEARTVVLRPVR